MQGKKYEATSFASPALSDVEGLPPVNLPVCGEPLKPPRSECSRNSSRATKLLVGQAASTGSPAFRV